MEIPKTRWRTTVSADGTEEREVGQVAEITDLVDLSAWPVGTRMLVRREEPHPGSQLTFTDVDGHRFQVFITDHRYEDICFLEALYRGRGRCECAIREAKDTGLSHFPSQRFAINRAWLAVVCMAGDLLAWTKGLCLEGDLAHAEPKRLRYTLLHTAGMVVRSARRTTLRLAQGWPWVGHRSRGCLRPVALLAAQRHLTGPVADRENHKFRDPWSTMPAARFADRANTPLRAPAPRSVITARSFHAAVMPTRRHLLPVCPWPGLTEQIGLTLFAALSS
jgi:hypothetical protein